MTYIPRACHATNLFRLLCLAIQPYKSFKFFKLSNNYKISRLRISSLNNLTNFSMLFPFLANYHFVLPSIFMIDMVSVTYYAKGLFAPSLVSMSVFVCLDVFFSFWILFCLLTWLSLTWLSLHALLVNLARSPRGL